MAKPHKITPLTDEQIGNKISLGVNFWVFTNPERKAALTAAKFAGVSIMTRARKSPTAGFDIYFLYGGAK